MGIFSGVSGGARNILTFGMNLAVNVSGVNRLGALGKKMDSLRAKFISMGVTTIFLDRLVQSLTRAWTAFNGVIGVNRVAKASEAILGLSKFSGVATDRLQAFAGAASVVGAELNDVSDLMQTLTERVDDLRSGTEQGVADDFARFGLSAKTFEGANNGLDQFLILMRELDKLAPERRMAALEKILGGDLARKFGQLGNYKEIAAAMQEAIDTGQVLSEQQLKQGERFAQAQRRVGRLMTALSNNIGSALLPVLTEAANVLGDFISAAATFFNSHAMYFGQKLKNAFTPFLDKVKEIKDFINSEVMDLGEFIAEFAQGILLIVTLLGTIAFGKIIGAAVVIGGVVTAVSFLITDIITFMRGGESLIGTMLRNAPALQVFLGGALAMVTGIKAGFENIVIALKQLANGPIFPLITAFLGVAMTIIGSIVMGVGALINLFVRIANVVVELIGLIGQGLNGVLTVVGNLLGLINDDAASRVLGGISSRITAAGGLSGALSNAFTGNGPTTTEMLLLGQQGARTVHITQNNNIHATSSNPEQFAINAVEASGRGLASTAG